MKKINKRYHGGGNGIKSCCLSKRNKSYLISGKTMGTTYHVKYLDEGSMKATSEKTHEEIEAILKM